MSCPRVLSLRPGQFAHDRREDDGPLHGRGLRNIRPRHPRRVEEYPRRVGAGTTRDRADPHFATGDSVSPLGRDREGIYGSTLYTPGLVFD